MTDYSKINIEPNSTLYKERIDITEHAHQYCDLVRRGQRIDMECFVDQLPDQKSKIKFKQLVFTILILDSII